MLVTCSSTSQLSVSFKKKNQSKSITNCPPGISTQVEHCVTKGVYDETFGMGLLLLLFVRR